ncbi:MAG: recombinase family protein [Arcobacteraceae bacterium]|jgi:DNA invertase Pin-like site-specific DNA recombinase|nr:recombinase family protein [Arcobacteraceae bacterium]
MEKIISFIRINKNNEEYTQNQAIGIAKYLHQNNLQLNNNVEIEINVPEDEERIATLLTDCKRGCTILVYDLNVFGRTISSILEMLKNLLNGGVRIVSINQNLDLESKDDMLTKMILGIISMTISLEKDLMSIRTKEALTAKKLDGMSLGKPKGTIQKSKFDKKRDKIEELLSVGLSVRKIAKLLGYNNHIGLNNYVKKRNIREIDDKIAS